jgi:hypothetical protein
MKGFSVMRLNNSPPPSPLKLNSASNVQRSGSLFLNGIKLESPQDINQHTEIAIRALFNEILAHVRKWVIDYPSALFQHWSKASLEDQISVLDALHLAKGVAPERYDLHFNKKADSLSNPSIKFFNNETGESVEVNPLDPSSLKTWVTRVRPIVEEAMTDAKIRSGLEGLYTPEWNEKRLPKS